ncbi:TPA: beta strand repeat-containing protein, partial [Haemophilus influenzae]
KNEGVISVNGGSISLLAGQKITISDIANPTITYSIAAPENEAVNLGNIFTKGGKINVRAANIRNQGKLSADSVSKDKSGNIVLSAKEGEAEIGGVISAQNQQAKGGKLMITGDKVTLKTGAVIDLSGKEGGETYLGGDERGEGKNGIQLAKKTTLEKDSTINVSGKEKGGRAIVWGDVALINGNINAQGSDIAETGGFVETSGHYLSIDDNVIVKTKEWLLDPEDVEIKAPDTSRTNTAPDEEFPTGQGSSSDPKKNNTSKTILTNTTISELLKNAKTINITASRKITVNSSINIGSDSHLYLWSEKRDGGIEINEDITSQGGNLTIGSNGWIDIHKNITLGEGFLNITAGNSVAFEGAGLSKSRAASSAQITAQGSITVKSEKELRLNNVSINGMGKGLDFITNQNNFTHKLDGEINISGIVTINQTTHKNAKYWQTSKDSFWNVTSLNLNQGAKFTFIKFVSGNSAGRTTPLRSSAGVIFDSQGKDMNFNVGSNARVFFKLKSNEITNKEKPLPHRFNSNITANGTGSIFFDIYANHSGRGVDLNMSSIDIKNGVNLTFNSHVRGDSAFKISKDLTINASGSQFNLEQTLDSFSGDRFPQNAISSTHNITILKGNVTLGGRDSSSSITGTVSIASEANVTLQAKNGYGNNKKLTLGNVLVDGKLNLTGASANINGNLTVNSTATFNGITDNNLNITGTFTNNGTSVIDVKKGAAKLGNITNEGDLNITTHAKTNQETIITGNITNKRGSLNITNNGNDTEIQIGGNISQKEGNLTISSDKVNITKHITIKAGVDGENSDSANLTIKTKTLELTNDLNISGFNKAEITAKNGSDLTIGETNSGGANTNTKKVTFNNVKNSEISANGHNVTLNSKVETSGSNGRAESNSDNDTGLTINAKNVTVNNNITSHKAVNITASAGDVTTRAGTTINATTGNVEITAQTGNIQGGVESTSGDVTLTATGETLAVGNISGNTVSVTANSGTLTTKAGSTIKGTESVTTSSQSGEINGDINAENGAVTVTAKNGALNVANITSKTVGLTANNGALTTKASSTINATDGVTTSSQSGNIGGTISGKTVNVKATESLTTQAGSAITGDTVEVTASGKLTTQTDSKIEAKSGEANVTGATGTIDGTVSGKTVNVTASTGSLTVGGNAKINATEGAATLTATKGTLTTNTGSSITSTKGQVDLSAQDGSIAGQISAANVTL